ncbi:3-oxoacyl-ACP reductase FabG [Ignatzschineria cameli]|uniref:3-oxoacyl-ACP reductase FabG n=1 Tax=Ignatzschineria cameli TaxID=2182793 RepID=A0A2U2ARH3_9GAMM|nr:3-oxoacyl-ACP reductase FabG [Ignatzschineria cameli]PWD85182.1 3-oxoacyl-ACP reductase FabG [Ignatzschineria cameli]PWD86392.1 3-oxoacyl-ACP reductase FabG [Ignatzschineria cameli]PWD89770.1 3-oxoacyl-ACP reductase FabG [Ignatzschineria cameli]PWD91420.1 3-oxoacyl-ACP reductase FabG [Ignatzschineria cameli]PWD92458.1 3-oxoacyl-ACP reductase FabG [Ignatzschineria cameli]
MFSLNKQIAIVTGGAKGIGRGIVEALIEAEATVIIADIDTTAGRKTAQELDCDFVELDVTDQSLCQTRIKEVIEKYGRLDILCSNTGIFPQATIEEMTEKEWDFMQEVNVKGTFFIVQAALNAMKQQGYGRVIITSSITGNITGFPGWSHYGASKAAQLGFMRSAALEYARFGITVNAVLPGNILTEGLKAQGETYLNQMRATIPTHTLGEPKDIGYAAAFLASKEAKYITGQTIIIDGGQILPESPEALL